MTLSLALLGTFDLRYDGQPISDFRAQSVRALLAYLAIEANRPHEREHLCALLWPDEPLQTALTSLRQALHRLRQAIEPAGEEGRYLLITRQSVQLNAAAITIDFHAFQQALQAVAAHRHRSAAICAVCAERLCAALDRYRGGLLPGFSFPGSEQFEEWLLIERERLRNQLCGLIDQLAAYHERRGAFDAALDLLRRWVAVEPWHEPAHLRLIGALAHAGQRTLALRQFERYRAFLAADLGIEPSLAARQMIAEVRAGTIAPPQIGSLRHAPAAATPFIGRADELGDLITRLSDPACRLLTLTGMGGNGKTRLAIEAAQQVSYAFADGAVFVSLAPLDHAEAIPEALSNALGLELNANQPILDQLIEQLAPREILLLLDNCEQVAGIGPLVAQLLAGAPRLAVLATSRGPLDLRCEWVVPLDGLALPPCDAVAPAPESYTAGQLFLQIARQVAPAFAPGTGDTEPIRQCCALLSGSPLAIELAATQLRRQPVAAIVAALRTDLDMLATTMSDVAPRHRSLRAIFDWSWRLLDPSEQHALAGLAVFAGGCDQAAAQAVIGDTEPLDRLAAKSLLRRDSAGRYALHAQIRQFAAERLAQLGESAQALRRHCTYYLGLAAAHAAQIDGPQAAAIIVHLQIEQGNLRQAWDHAADQPDYALLCSAAPVFGQIYARGDLHEGCDQLARLLGQIRPEAGHAAQARQHLLEQLIGKLKAIGQVAEASARADELLALSRTIADPLGEAAARLAMANLVLHQRDFAAAWEHLHAADRLSAADRSRRGRAIYARSLSRRASLIDWQQLPVDRSYAERAYAIYCELDMPHLAGDALNRLGNQHRRCGDYGRSLEARRKALALIAPQGDLDLSVGVRNDLGEIYLLLGCYRQARAVFEQALAMARRLRLAQMEVVLLEGLGRALFHLGDLRLAAAQVEHALAIGDRRPNLAHRGYFLTTLGYVAEQARDWEAATRHYSEAVAWWAQGHHCSDAVVEPQAGLARVALAHHQPRLALARIEPVLPHLAQGVLQDALEPMQVHLTCYRALAAAGDQRAGPILAAAHRLISDQADQISDPALRDSFLYEVVAHRSILSLGASHERSAAA